MGQYTIRISDTEGGMRSALEGEAEPGSLAGMTAMALAMQAQKMATALVCQCPFCKASRIATNESKQTIH